MPRKSKRGRGRRGPMAREVIAISPSEALEEKRASSSDTLVLRDRFVGGSALTVTPVVIANINPQALGTRTQAIAGVFTRYKIKDLTIKFMSAAAGGTNASVSALGVIDDSSATSPDVPTSFPDVVNLRCSATDFSNQTMPTYLKYVPVDRDLWYYCQAGVTGSDPRLSNLANLYGACSGTGISVAFQIDYTIVFKGAAS